MKNKTSKKTLQNQEGQIALFIVFVIMALLLFIALFLANVVIKQTKVTRNNLNSIQAYYLADMGVERALYGIKKGTMDIVTPNIGDEVKVQNDIIETGSSYTITKTNNSFLISIKASGVFKETSRAVELSWD